MNLSFFVSSSISSPNNSSTCYTRRPEGFFNKPDLVRGNKNKNFLHGSIRPTRTALMKSLVGVLFLSPLIKPGLFEKPPGSSRIKEISPENSEITPFRYLHRAFQGQQLLCRNIPKEVGKPLKPSKIFSNVE